MKPAAFFVAVLVVSCGPVAMPGLGEHLRGEVAVFEEGFDYEPRLYTGSAYEAPPNVHAVMRFLASNLGLQDAPAGIIELALEMSPGDVPSVRVRVVLRAVNGSEHVRLVIPFDKVMSEVPGLALLDTEFHVDLVDGRQSVVIEIPLEKAREGMLVSSFRPVRGERWFTFGCDESVRLSTRPMFVSLTATPLDVTVKEAFTDTANGSARVDAYERSGELRVMFEADDCSGQLVLVNADWLRSFGIRQPRFESEHGDSLPREVAGASFAIHVPHFSPIIIYDDFSETSPFTFSVSGGSSFVASAINERSTIESVSPEYSLRQGFTGGLPDRTDSGVIEASRTYHASAISRLDSISCWFKVGEYAHDGSVWDYLRGGLRFALADVTGRPLGTWEYWLFSWSRGEDYMVPWEAGQQVSVYGKPEVGIWLRFSAHPDDDWPDIPWSGAGEITVSLWLHASGTSKDVFEVYYDDLTLTMETSQITYIFKGAVAPGATSPQFQFVVPFGIISPLSSVYVSVFMRYWGLGAGTFDADLSVWDASGARSGGATASESEPALGIPHSEYSSWDVNPEYVIVSNISAASAGVWWSTVYCSPSTDRGVSYEIVVDVYVNERVRPLEGGARYPLWLPVNTYRLDARIEHADSHDFDLSLWDSAGRRTGGWIEQAHETAQWIPWSAQSTSAASGDLVTVSPVGATYTSDIGGDAWQFMAYCRQGASAGNYHITITLELDSDGDGVRDAVDLDPVRDLCVRFEVTELIQLDPVDRGDNPWDPYIRIAIGLSVPKRTVEGGTGDAWQSQVWSRSKEPIVKDGDFTGSYTMWKNVPDNLNTVPLLIQVWDDDGRRADDICDISRMPGGGDADAQDGSTLHLFYNVLTGRWSGDTVTGESSGEWDGSVGSSGKNDENDALIRFSITTDSELSMERQVRLASEFSPVMFFSDREHYHPVETWGMLNQSDLRRTGSKELLENAPVSNPALVTHRTGSYLDLVDTNQAPYRRQMHFRVFTSDNDTVVVQFWFFYIYDLGSPHAGDWEMIQLVFPERSRYFGDEELEPAFAVYSQHYQGEVKPWEDDGVLKEGSHPLVFVERGGHASKFSGYQTDRQVLPLAMMSPGPWQNYAGKWGGSTWSFRGGGNSVEGPVYRCSMKTDWFGKPTSPIAYMWHEPLYWMDKS